MWLLLSKCKKNCFQIRDDLSNCEKKFVIRSSHSC